MKLNKIIYLIGVIAMMLTSLTKKILLKMSNTLNKYIVGLMT